MISFEFHLEKWHEKPQKPLWFLGFPNRYLFRFAMLVAGGGHFITFVTGIYQERFCVSPLLRCPAEATPGEAGLLLADRCHSLRSLLPPPAALPSLPQRATLVGLITWVIATKPTITTKKKPHPDGWGFFLVAGGGLEPPTSGL